MGIKYHTTNIYTHSLSLEPFYKEENQHILQYSGCCSNTIYLVFRLLLQYNIPSVVGIVVPHENAL